MRLMLIAIFLTLLSITSMGPLPAEGYDTNREELKFTILTLAGSQDSVTGGAMIAFDLSEIGFDMTMKVEESSVMYQKIEDYGYYENSQSYDNEEDPVDEVRPYDMIYMGLSSSTMFPTGLYSLCHTKRDYRGGDNQWGVHNATLDGHLDWMLNGTIPQIQYHAYEAQTILNDIMPYIHVLYQEDAMLIRKDWTGMHTHPTGLISDSNPFTVIDFHNTTALPSGRDGAEWVMRYFKGANEGNADGLLYYEATTARMTFLSKLIWEPLVVVNDDNSILPWLADSYAVAADGMSYNFTLRPGLKFQDGNDVTPEDVKFSFDWLRSNENESLWGGSLIYYIDNCTIQPDDTITFYMREFDSWGIYTFADLLIFEESVIGTVPYNDPSFHDLTNTTTKWTGTGPWKFNSVEATDSPTYWMFDAFDQYWFSGMNGTPCEEVTTYPRMDKFTIRVITDESATVSALRATSGTTVDCTRYSWPSLTQAASSYLSEIDIVSAPSIWRKILWINNKINPLSDPIVRKAMAYAINYESICAAAEGGWAIPIYAQWLPLDIYGTTWNNVAANVYTYDKDMANDLLDDAGYLDTNDDGIRENPGYVPPGSTATSTSSEDGGAGFSVLDAFLLFTGSMLALAIFKKRRQ